MKTSTNTKAITSDVTIQSELELVWYAWTLSERVSQWFAPEAVVDPKVGGSFELYFIPGNKEEMNTRGCKILKLIEKETLVFTWKGPDPFQNLMNKEDELTVVNVKFEKVDDSNTKVVVTHDGFKEEEIWSEAFNWHQAAWKQVLASLKSALEKGEGALCCQP
ncbi:SRPBCC family protein [Salirhabdus sp. Marseille-P4669]|uniref:SRPBCC family protein n=1 Tax=Salirhabdus sp. Marseille-P4669 TaxID=2042310 RepID=UPI000C7973E0|nr:SRPBCC domain-containing protein [Salirhabdus sp. Marseille-P4669]